MTADLDWSKTAWDKDFVGVWYGNWSVEDFREAEAKAEPWRHLTEVNRRNGTPWPVNEPDFNTAKRFFNIREQDWVVLYFDNALHLAQVRGEPKSDDDNLYGLRQQDGNRLKYRRIEASVRYRYGCTRQTK